VVGAEDMQDSGRILTHLLGWASISSISSGLDALLVRALNESVVLVPRKNDSPFTLGIQKKKVKGKKDK
jgi:hypothetical protein